MRFVRPELNIPTTTLAEEQEEYMPVTVGHLINPLYGSADPSGLNTILLALRPSEEERQALIDGKDLYVALLTFGTPMQPIMVMVGKDEAAARFNLEVV